MARTTDDAFASQGESGLISPLEGITVVSVEQAVAAPLCTARLADAGARVIKIERPEGDFARYYDTVAGGESSYFVWLNRGKESVTLDLAQAQARETLVSLIGQADILVQNLKPGAFERLGFPIEVLRARHPRLICCSISGYGDQGPYAHRKAYDLLIQAESGLCSITGGPAEASRVGVSIVDIATGGAAYSAILEALIARGRSGAGADIRVSMFDVIAEWLTVPLLHADSGDHPRRIGLAHPSIAPYGVFPTRDGRALLISIQNDNEWIALCNGVLERPELAVDARFATNVRRVQLRGETDALVTQTLGSLDATDLIERLSKAEIAFAEVNDLHGLSRHPHLRRISVETSSGAVSIPAPPAIVDGSARRLGSVPSIGEHTASVLQALSGSRRE